VTGSEKEWRGEGVKIRESSNKKVRRDKWEWKVRIRPSSHEKKERKKERSRLYSAVKYVTK
jgi:hypothetical protein